MILENKKYYYAMLDKGRLVPVVDGDNLVAFVTFYVSDNIGVYVQADPWDILEDNSNGKICYVAQLLTTKEHDNARSSMKYFKNFKNYIKLNFPTVRTITWRRWDSKKNIVKTYSKEI